MIPEFELPSIEHTEIRLDVPRLEAFEKVIDDHDDLRIISEQQLGPTSSNGVEKELLTSQLNVTEDIESHLSFLLNGLSLYDIHRTHMVNYKYKFYLFKFQIYGINYELLKIGYNKL